VKRWACIFIAVAISATPVLLPMLARATHQDPTDGRDTKGRLDIRHVKTWGPHANTGFRIDTYRGWSSRFVWDSGFFVVNVDSFGTPGFDYYVLVRSTGKKMEGLLFRDRTTKRDYRIGKVRVWRPDAKSIKFRFPWGSVRFPERRRFFRWSAQSIFTNDYCPNVCFDDVPNSGVIVTTVRPQPTTSASATP
jgi:hypothetical protein